MAGSVVRLCAAYFDADLEETTRKHEINKARCPTP